ncbi:NADPH2:quinone reductase [Novosphingobium sp. PhB57]|uniref:quinone oxidoreductase family protein n=1 Tax=Novosphingobium sp. PhB57 TaxID=2485107 RepID=UPI0010490CA8|nr:quinone oxidoreductase [Novosphingobium sp. PhB57]TCU54684.1 NADPH2:quinone reductase [Novosphingobium sp. PhB57]
MQTLSSKAIQILQQGAPDVLRYEDVAIRPPGAGEVLVRNRAIGVNFVDIYLRSGAFPAPHLPFTPGKEGAGEVVSIGEGVTGFSPGDRVAFVETLGAYAELCIVPAHFLVQLPAAVSFEIAAASMLKGLTAQYLLRRTFRVEPGHVILVHAAAGGVGLILTQWAKHLGATVIGTVGSAEKAALARENGCDHVIDYRREDFVARVREITGGDLCHVVYDGVGKDVFAGSLDCLRPFGTFVNFGWASGRIEAFDMMALLEKGSLDATSPGLTQYLAKREDVIANARDLFDVIASGAVKVRIHGTLPLSQAAEAHRLIEARHVTGGINLVP